MKKAKATSNKQIKKSASKKQTKSLTKSTAKPAVKATAKKQTSKPSNKGKAVAKTTSKSPVQVKSAKKQTSNVNSDKTVKSVQTGIQILNYATKNKTSISEAARKNGLGRNYVSDVKARIDNNYKKKSISKELYDSFKNSSKNYDNSNKK